MIRWRGIAHTRTFGAVFALLMGLLVGSAGAQITISGDGLRLLSGGTEQPYPGTSCAEAVKSLDASGVASCTAGGFGTVLDVTGTADRITIGGTPTIHPTVDIASTYVGQVSLTTLGTIITGAWNGSSISTTYTDAKVATVTGTANRLTIGGTATDPTFDVSTNYVGQTTITTLGTIGTGVWQGSSIATTYTDAKVVSVSCTTITCSGTNPASFSVGNGAIANAQLANSAITINGTSVSLGGTRTLVLASADHANEGSTITLLHGNAAGNPAWSGVALADFVANQGTTTTVLHGNAAGTPTFAAVVSADMNITTSSCTNQFVTAISAGGVGTCSTATLASAQFANQGTTTTVLHGAAAGNPSFSAVSLTADVSGTLPVANGGTNITSYAVGDLLYADGATSLAKLADVAAGSYLRSGGVAVAPLWSTLILPNAATVNRVVYATSANTWGDSANLTYDGTTLTLAGVQAINPPGSGGITITSPATSNASITLTSTVSNGYGALMNYNTKTAGGVAQQWVVGVGVIDGLGTWAIYDGTTGVSTMAIYKGGFISLRAGPGLDVNANATFTTGIVGRGEGNGMDLYAASNIIIRLNGTGVSFLQIPSASGVRFLCINTAGLVVSQAAACVGT